MQTIKMRWIAVIAAVIFPICAIFSGAYYYSLDYSCKNETCIEGEQITWQITLANDGNHKMEFTKIELHDMLTKEVVAKYEPAFNPQNSERGESVVVYPYRKKTINFTSTLPKQNWLREFAYYPCITNAVIDTYSLSLYENYETTHCYEENYTVDVAECLSSNDCAAGSYCLYEKCLKLSCGQCQGIVDHKCVDYECCEGSDCSPNQACINNSCTYLNCLSDEFVFNNSCTRLNCTQEQYIEDHECVLLECKEDEFAFNHSCISLDCGQDELAMGHRCKKIQCLGTEYLSNKTCVKLSCKDNQAASGHKCNDLKCRFYQKIAEHACVNNNSVIFKLMLEIFAFAMISIFIYLDIKEYRKNKAKPAKSAGISKE